MSSFAERTKISHVDLNVKMDLGDSAVFIGSCFSELVGRWLGEHKIDVHCNPMGIVYNPVSLATQLIQGLEKTMNLAALLRKGDYWVSWDYHSEVWDTSSSGLQKIIYRRLEGLHDALMTSRWLFVTLGTAWVYHHRAMDRIVTNCHKVPQHEFQKDKLTIDQVVEALAIAFERIKTVNPDLQIVCTVSPIRHIKDGLIENQRSKATLLLACEQLESNSDHIHYFPAYEMMIDDLRDYRYYHHDLIHPNEVAVSYVRQHFVESMTAKSLQTKIEQINRLHLLLNHRIKHPTASHIQHHLEQCKKSLLDCKNAYPNCNWEDEENLIEQMSNVSR